MLTLNFLIFQLVIRGRAVDMVHDAVGFASVRDCDREQTPCSRRPCQNNGVCEELSPTDYICRCPSQFTGRFSNFMFVIFLLHEYILQLWYICTMYMFIFYLHVRLFYHLARTFSTYIFYAAEILFLLPSISVYTFAEHKCSTFF